MPGRVEAGGDDRRLAEGHRRFFFVYDFEEASMPRRRSRSSGSMCPRCFALLESSGAALVHFRHCRLQNSPAHADADIVISRPPKRLRLQGVFHTDAGHTQVGLGPGGGVRREDEMVMVHTDNLPEEERCGSVSEAAHAAPQCAQEVTEAGADEVLEDGVEWTTAASSEEVVEALRRTLLFVGAATGAKTTDHIISLLRHPSLDIRCPALVSGIVSHRELVRDANCQVEETLKSQKFECLTVRDPVTDDGVADMWWRDPVSVIRRQVAETKKGARDTSVLYLDAFEHLNASGERLISHPLSTDLAHTVQSNVRARVQWGNARDEEGVRGWRDGYDFVLFLQVYSDKSLQTMKAASHAHYPLHVAIVNTSITLKEKLICRGDTVLGYLPTNLKWDPEDAKQFSTDVEDSAAGRGSRESKLRIQNASIEKCLGPLLNETVRGIDVRDATGAPFRCHPVLWSYVTDLPEGWDMSSSIHGRCSRCTVKKCDLGCTEASAAKDVSTAVMFYDDLERPHSKKRLKQVANTLKDRLSLNTVRPYLLSLGSNYGVDVFRMLRYEKMHNVHLGLTRTLLECMSARLRSSSLTTPELRVKTTGEKKTFGAVRTSVLRALNHSLQLYERHSPVLDFRISHRSQKTTKDLNGLFKKDGVASMLEARDYSRILQMMPFLGATCDRLCGEPGTTARLFTEYVELVMMMTSLRSLTAVFSMPDLDKLQSGIVSFMEAARELYGDFQASEMGTPKFHALVHVVADILEAGCLAHNRADAYEAAHKIVKAAYRAGSQRGDQGHTEAVGVISRADLHRQSSGTTTRGARLEIVSRLSERKARVRGARTSTKVEAVEKDSVELVRCYLVARPGRIYKFLKAFRASGSLVRQTLLPFVLRSLVSDLGGLHNFAWYMDKLQLGPTDSLLRANSAYVSGFPQPVLTKSNDGTPMLVSVDREGDGDIADGRVPRELQRIIAAHRFHNSKHPIQQTVMIDAGGPKATLGKLHKSVRDSYAGTAVREVWIAKVLAFVTVRRRPLRKRMGERCTTQEVALVQYFDTCAEPDDEVDKALRCTKLKWARECDDGDLKRSARGVYGVVDTAAIRGFVHVIRGDYGLEKTRTYGCVGDRNWFKSWFYINRFKLAPSGTKLTKDADPMDVTPGST